MKIPMGKVVEDLLSKVKMHASLAHQSVKILSRILSGYAELSLESLRSFYEELSRVEHSGDDLKRELIKDLTTGPLHPDDREDLMKAVLTLDEIPGLSRAVAKKMLVFKHINVEIPPSLTKHLHEMAEKSATCVEKLCQVITAFPSDMDKVLDLSAVIDQLEREVDDMRLKALEELFKTCKESLGIHCVALYTVIDDVELITDRCRDVATIYSLNLVSKR